MASSVAAVTHWYDRREAPNVSDHRAVNKAVDAAVKAELM